MTMMETYKRCILAITLLPVLFIGHLSAEKQVKILQGPDPDAIYMQLESSKYTLDKPPRQYIHQKPGDIIIRMYGFINDDSPGDPALPYKIFQIALPPDVDLRSLQVEISDLVEKKLTEPIQIVPAPPFLLDQEARFPQTEEEYQWELEKWGVGKKIVEGRNTLIYNKDMFSPSEYVGVNSSGMMRKWKIATVRFYPVRYNPVQKKALLAEKIGIKIKFQRDPSILKEARTIELLRDKTFDSRAKKWYNQPLLEEPDRVDGPIHPDPNYAIITTETTYSSCTALEDFCFHKQHLGYSVIVVTEYDTHEVDGTPGSYFFTDTGGGYEDVIDDEPPHQRPQKIRKWLMDNYLSRGIVYALLIGDPDPDNIRPDDHFGDIPMQMVWIWPLVIEHPTDLYYSDLSWEWNHDGDDYVGENAPFAGTSNLPAGVTGGLFSALWEGVVHISGTADPVDIRFLGYTDGQTEIVLDLDDDGTYETEVFSEDTGEHHPAYYSEFVEFPNGEGAYPVRITYRQSSGDAYFNLEIRNYMDDVDSYFKHEVAPDTYGLGLEVQYFNNDTLTAPSVMDDIEFRPDIEYIASGDRGIDGVDFYPEVILGRIPVYDEDGDSIPDCTILNPILNKIIEYENANIHHETWRRRVLASAPWMYDEDSDRVNETADYEGCEYLRDHIASPPFWEWFRIHDEDYGVGAEITDGCTVDKTVDAWNDPADPDDGRGVVMWRTHGGQVSVDFVFHEDRCADLDNSKPSIVIQTTCQNGHPEVEFWGGSNHYPLGYSLLKQGAVATICATRNSTGGTFDETSINIASKNNPYLLYFFAKGIFDNIKVGEVVTHVREYDALSSYWPKNILNYNLYGDPTVSLFGLRPKSNNDVVLVLDGSGSMLNENKWEAAKDAAVIFYNLMEALRHEAFKDQYNSIVFRCVSMADETTAVPPGSTLKDISEPLMITDFDPYTPLSTHWTPIGGGLQAAVEQFDLSSKESFYSNKSIVLLSDGRHNCGIDPLSVTIPDEVKVYAIGLGEDDIEPDTIEDIADSTEGEFRITPDPMEIEDFFLQILCNTSWKLQDVPVADDAVNIDEGIAAFIIVWDESFTSVSFDLQPPGGGPVITPGDLTAYPGMNCTYHAPLAGENHTFYVCQNIPLDLMGEWHFTNLDAGGTSVDPADILLKVIEDPQIIADFEIENVDHFTGEPIFLSAKVSENGRPKTSLTEVYAELIRSPAGAIGTLMSVNEPDPDYRSLPSNKADITLRSHYLAGIMKKLNMDTLLKVGGPRISFRDDGTGGDLRANDGIYTSVFTDTQYEGSYTFRFKASGKNKNGVRFDRTETLSDYVKLSAAPDQTEVEVVSTVVNQNEGIEQVKIRVIPKDRFESYLGPFRGNLIKIWSSVGSASQAYEDNKDGSYVFTLIHPIGEEPLISVSVGDVIVIDRESVDSLRPQPVEKDWGASLDFGLTVPSGGSFEFYLFHLGAAFRL